MYGGEEVSAVVLDVGTSFVKAGWAGEDNPKALFTSCIGVGPNNQKEKTDAGEWTSGSVVVSDKTYYAGTNSLAVRRDAVEIAHPLKAGLISRWDEYEQLLNYTFRGALLINPSEHQVLLSEPTFNTKAIREKTTELLFEKYRVPALFLSKAAVLASFASGRSTSVVVDSGGAGTSVVSVFDGYALLKTLQRSQWGGDRITSELVTYAAKKNITLHPHYEISRKGQTISYKNQPNTTASTANTLCTSSLMISKRAR